MKENGDELEECDVQVNINRTNLFGYEANASHDAVAKAVPT